MTTKITSIDIIEYLREIDRKSKEVDEDDGFRRTREIAEELGLTRRAVRAILKELDEKGALDVQKVNRKILGGYGRILAYRIKLPDDSIETNGQ